MINTIVSAVVSVFVKLSAPPAAIPPDFAAKIAQSPRVRFRTGGHQSRGAV